MKKNIIALLLVITALIGVSSAKEKTINIALWKLPLNLPAMFALQDKTYEKAFTGDRKINYVPLPSGPRQIQAIGAGQLDIGEGLGATTVLVGAAAGVDLKIIGVCSRSPRGFAIVVNNPEIKGIKDLRGKKIAGIRGSVVHQLYMNLLEENGLGEKDVEFYPMTLPAATAALLAGHVDAALLAGMEIIHAEKGGARVLADGEGRLSGLSLIVANSVFIDKNPGVVEKYLLVRNNILTEMRANPAKFIDITMREIGIAEEEARNIISWYDFNNEITSNDISELNMTIDYLKKTKIISGQVDITRMIYREAGK